MKCDRVTISFVGTSIMGTYSASWFSRIIDQAKAILPELQDIANRYSFPIRAEIMANGYDHSALSCSNDRIISCIVGPYSKPSSTYIPGLATAVALLNAKYGQVYAEIDYSFFSASNHGSEEIAARFRDEFMAAASKELASSAEYIANKKPVAKSDNDWSNLRIRDIIESI